MMMGAGVLVIVCVLALFNGFSGGTLVFTAKANHHTAGEAAEGTLKQDCYEEYAGWKPE